MTFERWRKLYWAGFDARRARVAGYMTKQPNSLNGEELQAIKDGYAARVALERNGRHGVGPAAGESDTRGASRAPDSH